MPRPSPDTWRSISPWLDEVLDLPREARAAFLQRLVARDPRAAESLAGWLREYELMDATAFLQEPGAPVTGVPRGRSKQRTGP